MQYPSKEKSKMSLIGKIMEKLGFKKEVIKEATAPKSTPSPTSTYKPEAVAPKPKPMSPVDVVAKLDGMAAKNPQELNWKRSIVDLLKLLDMDSSYEARKELATELHCPADLMDDSAKMNTWLHKSVLRKLAENGGNVPKELLD
jgi:hypothetical protein